ELRRDRLRSLPELVRDTVAATDADIEVAAKLLYLAPSIHLLATRIAAVAKEGALKIREVVLNHTEGFEASEFKHGPNTILGFNTVLGPARVDAMLKRLGHTLSALVARAAEAQLALTPIHAAAEALPLAAASTQLVVIADALHFMDAHRTGRELARILAQRAALAFVQVELGDAPFMQALTQIMHEAAPRRPKRVAQSTAQVAALAGVQLTESETFDSTLALDSARLERILDSISFIGPAMNTQRRADFHARIHAIAAPRVWHIRIRLEAGRVG
ncbi:MAG: methyltransferase domain-containing protein, partial [Polyangiales bacterium]